MFGQRCFHQSVVLGALCVLVIMQFKALMDVSMKDVLDDRSQGPGQAAGQGQGQTDALKRQVTQLRQEKKEWEEERLSLYAGQRESASSNTRTGTTVAVASPEKVKVPPSIAEIMQRTGTDKLSTHHYEWAYADWLQPFRFRSNLTILEIGADKGRSMALWADYFENPALILALAYGSDAKGIDDKVDTQGFATRNQDKLKIIWGDQSKATTMKRLCAHGPFDVIIDDGSHVPAHMVFSLVKLLPCLVEGGLYVIEDVETNYWDASPHIFGYAFDGVGIGTSPKHNAIKKFKQLVEVINRNEICRDDLSVLPGDEFICELAFHSNLIKIVKCTEEQRKFRRDACLKWKQHGMVDQQKVDTWMKDARDTNIDAILQDDAGG
jgi:hypothetical protein